VNTLRDDAIFSAFPYTLAQPLKDPHSPVRNVLGGAVLGAALLAFAGTANATCTASGSTNQTVNVTTGASGDVCGGLGADGTDANDNKVFISGPGGGIYTVGGNVYGGLSTSAEAAGAPGGNANHNAVTISGNNVDESVYGGSGGHGGVIVGSDTGSDGGSATDNTIAISNSTVGGSIYGGSGGTGSHGEGGGGQATSNTITISNSTVATDVYGGSGGSGGNNDDVGYGLVDGGSGGNADKNTITISSTAIDGSIYGGSGGYGGDGSGSDGSGDYHLGGNGGGASDNVVKISGGSIGGNVYGGLGGRGGDASGNGGDGGQASNNTVTISGGSIGGNVYGGLGGSGGTGLTSGSSGSANDNRIILKGSPTFGAGTILYGGNGTGNVLEIWTKGITVNDVQNFSEYDFLLPANTADSDTLLTLTGTGSTISGASVGVAMQGGGELLKTGDRVSLIHNDNGLDVGGIVDGKPQNVTQVSASQMKNSYLHQGISLAYQFSLEADADNLYARVQGAPQVLDQTKAPVEGIMGGMSMTQNAGSLAAGVGIGNAIAAARDTSGAASFSAGLGNSSRYDTGSHVDVDSWGLMLGLAKRFGNPAGALTAGAFFEAGWGSFDTYNSFTGSQSVHGNGHAHYEGGGILVRQDWQSGLYAEASLRGGRVSSDWGTREMAGAGAASYDTSAPYLGAHAGVGYILPLSARLSLDTSAKYFWTHQGGNDAVIAGDPYHFDAVDSQVSHLGVRANYAFTNQLAGYAGAAWEREFDGVARATVYGLSTAAPSLKGSTGVFELGVSLRPPAAKSALTLEMGVQGYTGKREGVGGTLKAAWVF
jgi:hypothetical protein